MTEKEIQEIKSRGFGNITEQELNSLNIFDKLEMYVNSFENIEYVFDNNKNLLYANLYTIYHNIGSDFMDLVFIDGDLINNEYCGVYTSWRGYRPNGECWDDKCLKIPKNAVIDDIDLYDLVKKTILELINNSTNIKKQEVDIPYAINRIKNHKIKH